MSPDVAKEVPVAAALDGKGNSPKVYEPTPNTLTDPMSNIPLDPVSASPIKHTRTRVVKPPDRFKEFVP